MKETDMGNEVWQSVHTLRTGSTNQTLHSGNSLCLEAVYLQNHLRAPGLVLTCTKEPTLPCSSGLLLRISCILQACPGVQNGTADHVQHLKACSSSFLKVCFVKLQASSIQTNYPQYIALAFKILPLLHFRLCFPQKDADIRLEHLYLQFSTNCIFRKASDNRPFSGHEHSTLRQER